MLSVVRAGLILCLLPGCLQPVLQECGDEVCGVNAVCNPYQKRCVPTDQLDCGNGVIDHEVGELCDINDPSSELDCTVDCRSDRRCGNFVVDEDMGEVCDCGADNATPPVGVTLADACMGRRNGQDRGFCNENCMPSCGDGVIIGPEECEGDAGDHTCLALGFDTGVLTCADSCRFDTSQCRHIGWYPSDDDVDAPIQAIWGAPDATSVFAVGAGGTFVKLTDEGRASPGPALDANIDLLDVWGTSARNVYAVGTGGVIVHYDGTTLSVTRVDDQPLVAVWGWNGIPVYVAGQDGSLYRGDFYESGPTPTDPSDALTLEWRKVAEIESSGAHDLWGVSDNDVFLVSASGRVFGFHYTSAAGQSPVRLSSGDAIANMEAMEAIGGTGEALIAVGASGRIFRYDGQQWTLEASGTTSRLLSAWGQGNDEMYAAGEDGVVLYFDGSKWRQLNTEPPDSDGITHVPQRFISGWSGGTSNVYAIDGRDGTMWRYQGVEWDHLVIDGQNDVIQGMWALQNTQGYKLYAATRFTDEGGQGRGRVWHYDDQGWISGTEHLPELAPLRTIAGSSAGNLYATGELGTVLQFNGVAWVDLTGYLDDIQIWNTSPTPTLHAVWVSPEGHAFVAGEDGTVIRYDALTGQWSNISPFPAVELTALWGRAGAGTAGEVFATGQDGVVYRYDGARWSYHYVNGDAPPALHGMWGDAGAIYAVGTSRREDGMWHYTILRLLSGDGQWHFMDPDIVSDTRLADLHAVWSAGDGTLYVAGENGTILHYNGAAWTQVSSFTQTSLVTVSGTPDMVLFGGGTGSVLSLQHTGQ